MLFNLENFSVSNLKLKVLFAILFSGLILAIRLPNLDAYFALNGFTPIYYAYQTVQPEQYIHNFYSGVETIDKSMLMWIYPILLRFFSIPPEITIQFFIFFEYFFYYLFACTLMRAIKPEAGFSLCTSLFLLMVASNARDINMANFAQPFFYGQFYNFADIFRVMAILGAFQRQILRSSLWLTATIPVHMMLAVMAGFAWGIALLSTYGKALFSNKRFYAALGIVLLGGVTWVLYSFNWENITAQQVALSTWYAWAKLGQCHWFPLTHGFLTYKHTYKLFPYLTFLLLLCHYYPKKESWRPLEHGLLWIAVVANVLTLVGLTISITATSPFLLKLALHRSNDLVVLLGLPYILTGLMADIETKPLFQKALATLLLISPFFITDRYPVLPAALLLLNVFVSSLKVFWQTKAPSCWTPRHLTMLGILTLMGTLLIFYGQHHWLSPFSKYAGTPKSLELFLIVLVVLTILLKGFKLPASKVPVLMTGVLLLGALHFTNRLCLHGEAKKTANSYLKIQEWAKTHTPVTASFIVTPELSGWRDYSQRSSFGSLREWTHDAWLYDSSPRIFNEGMKRVQLLGTPVQPDFHLARHPGNYEALNEYETHILKQFYQLPPAWFIQVGSHYHAQYLVLDKAQIKQAYPFVKRMENQHFVVYQLPSSKGHS